MGEPKTKPAKRVAGKSKFRLPERAPRQVDINPLRDILREAKAQEEALLLKRKAADKTPVKKIAGVARPGGRDVQKKGSRTPAMHVAGVSKAPAHARSSGQVTASAYAEFCGRWSPILRTGQMSVCRALFEMTHEVGEAECFISMPKLAAAAGLKERQCYNVVAQLELLGFIERPEIFNTSTQKGTIFRLHMEPRPPNTMPERRYHIGGEGRD